MFGKWFLIGGLALASLSGAPIARAQAAQRAPFLPMATVFKGENKFQALCARAERENWRALPIGARTAKVALAMAGTPYEHYTLEVDNRIESPVVNLEAMDCWTYYENALGFARMLKYKPAPYKPADLLQMVELERYRNGRCTGSYLSRMHHLEEVFYDNQRRGLASNITARIPGAARITREIREMQLAANSYRYLKNNPDLVPQMALIEQAVSRIPVSYIPKASVFNAERYLADGDICAIVGNDTSAYTTHVGLIVRYNGRAYFTHATSDREKGRKTLIDRPITDYVNSRDKHIGIIVCRPNDVAPR